MKDVEKMTSCCHHGTFGTAWPANRNAALRACMLHDRQGRVDFKCIFNWKLGSMLNANINLIANKMKQQSDSTDLSLCKWPRAHFTDTEGLLLGVSTVNTHHSERVGNDILSMKLLKPPTVSHLLHNRPMKKAELSERGCLNAFSTCHSWEWQHIAQVDPRSPPARSSYGHSRCTVSVLKTQKNVGNECNICKAHIRNMYIMH